MSPKKNTEPTEYRMVAEQGVQVTRLLVRLRAVVLALGEADASPWWRTRFMNETGLSFLSRLYPRTYFQAALHSAGKAACELHDRAIGRRGAYHLFRLPMNVELKVREFLLAEGLELLTELRPKLGNIDLMMSQLGELGGGVFDAAAGPRQVGTEDELGSEELVRRMAGVYHRAFSEGAKAFPYVESR